MNTYLVKDEDFIHNERMMPGDTAVLAGLTGPMQRALLAGKINLSFYGIFEFFQRTFKSMQISWKPVY